MCDLSVKDRTQQINIQYLYESAGVYATPKLKVFEAGSSNVCF